MDSGSACLRVVMSHRVAVPGDRMWLRIDGPDAASLTWRNIVTFEREDSSSGQAIAKVVAAPSVDGPSQCFGPDETVPVPLECYPAQMPLFFDVPPIPESDYHLRLDVIHGNRGVGDLDERIPTLSACLRVVSAD